MAEQDRLMERMQQLVEAMHSIGMPWVSRGQIAKKLGRRQLNAVDLMALTMLVERGQVEVETRPDPRPAGVVHRYRVKGYTK